MGGLPIIFIGSSSEGLEIGSYLQLELEKSRKCHVVRWDQGVFEASDFTLESLLKATDGSDFAALIVTPDDTVSTRGSSRAAARDNVILELGLFIGALGRERTYIVADQGDRSLELPSDLRGLTWLPYERRDDGNQQAAVNAATLGILRQVKRLGVRSKTAAASSLGEGQLLDVEIGRICVSAEAQGWRVRTNSDTTLRIQNPAGRSFTFSIGEPTRSRTDLRRYVALLRASGLRVNQSVRRSVIDAPVVRG